MTAKPIRFKLADVEEAVENNEGFCLACGEISESGVEMDASGYHCDSCGQDKVEGAGNILIMGLAD